MDILNIYNTVWYMLNWGGHQMLQQHKQKLLT